MKTMKTATIPRARTDVVLPTTLSSSRTEAENAVET
jgi:hypothetical protein